MNEEGGFNPVGKILGILWSLVALFIVMQLALALLKEMWPFILAGIIATGLYKLVFKRHW